MPLVVCGEKGKRPGDLVEQPCDGRRFYSSKRGLFVMNAQPAPDTIDPTTPQEMPPQPSPAESPANEPPEVAPPAPDIDTPNPGPIETPPPD
ncbi:MAG: hypothetical protein ABGW87_07530 [Sphingomonadaceae bacterium]